MMFAPWDAGFNDLILRFLAALALDLDSKVVIIQHFDEVLG
jgi:hypothetical protein